jgi:hypothetical protein
MKGTKMNDTVGSTEHLASPQTSAMRPYNAREILEVQMRGADQEMQDLRIILDMLPSRMTHEQDHAIQRTLLRNTSR